MYNLPRRITFTISLCARYFGDLEENGIMLVLLVEVRNAIVRLCILLFPIRGDSVFKGDTPISFL